MNRSLPPGDRGRRIPTPRRASGRGRLVLGVGGLVGGTAAIGGQSGVGARCATCGPRWLVTRAWGVMAKAAVTGTHERRAARAEAEKPAAVGAGRAGGRRWPLCVD